jgi:hypothetical protein
LHNLVLEIDDYFWGTTEAAAAANVPIYVIDSGFDFNHPVSLTPVVFCNEAY